MRRTRLVAAVVLAGSLLAAAQAAPDSKPATPQVYRWSEGCDGCKTVDMKGTQIKVQKVGALDVAVSLHELGNYQRAFVQVLNHHQDPVKIDPMAATLVLAAKSKTFAAVPPQKAASGFRNDANSESENLDASGCALMSSKSSPGPCQATGAGESESKSAQGLGLAMANDAEQHGMKPATIAPEDQTQGAIFFRTEKKKGEAVFRLPIGDAVYEFPFTVGAEKKR